MALVEFKSYQQQAWTRIAWQSLRQLNNELFACLLQPEYTENKYLFERRVHVAKNHFMRAACQLDEVVLTVLNQLYDLMLEYGQIRRRVTDPTIFSLCQSELIDMLQAINKVLMAASKRKINLAIQSIDTSELSASIERFEENYQTVLKITSQEPVVFLLFIFNLKQFCLSCEKY
ncbi:MAG TPA: hypothetical protein VHZ76_02650 [Gammaproteobacteria bacterium]|jgi:hypothetical protein|nr:hypothetical protein [Gammaproteobacteria bacterium]